MCPTVTIIPYEIPKGSLETIQRMVPVVKGRGIFRNVEVTDRVLTVRFCKIFTTT